MTQPAAMAIRRPVDAYRSAVFHPKRPKRSTSATSLIIGAAIRKEKVTPSGMPLSMNPMNSGIAEQEQKGVTMPSVLAMMLPRKSGFPSSAFLVFSGEK